MAVYVDTMQAPFGRMVMCHMWADSRDELFAMADRIGVQRKWFQRPDSPDALPGMSASWEHFDIAKSKRALAVRHGAIETDMYGPVEHTRRLDFIAAVGRGDFEEAAAHLRKLCIVGMLRRPKPDDDDEIPW